MGEYAKVAGLIEFVRCVEPTTGERLKAKWIDALKKEPHAPSFPSHREAESVTLLFDDTEFMALGQSYRGIGAAAIRDSGVAAHRLLELADQFLLDPAMPEPARDKLRRKGIHFADLPEDFRRRVVDLVARTSFRAHIAFGLAAGSKKAQMADLIGSTLKHRLSDQRGRLVSIVFEQGEYIKASEAENVVAGARDALAPHERPLRIEAVKVVSKLSEPCLALVDSVLGVWQHFAMANDSSRSRVQERDRLFYNTIRPRIATIFDDTTKGLFTSRRAFAPFAGTLSGVEASASKIGE